MKLIILFKLCLNETYNEIRRGKHLSDSSIQTALNQGYILLPLLFNWL
jgi:hypothetical protein